MLTAIFSTLKQPLPRVFLVIAITLSFSPQPLKAETMALTQTEIEQKIQTIPQWQQQNQAITRTFEFKNFVEAIAFVNKLVKPAEAAKHHPDITISYNKVTVSLSSHEAGGITQQDFDLAKTISKLAN
jgi:4a-hydroxytetrahydrobiopterin dehydratase